MLLQAIYTSSVNTLDHRQGLGLVYCSSSMPVAIREMLSRFDYSSDAGGCPIYSFERITLDGEVWLLLNRTVPAVDYTGRSSCVSHTLAMREKELQDCAIKTASSFPNVFEFMRQFSWKSDWNGEPRWESDEEALSIEGSLRSIRLAAGNIGGPRSSSLLLAFKASDGDSLLPYRAAWQIPGEHSDQILDFFASIWLALDPWRGESPYKGILDEPVISPVASWFYSFTTNLRNIRPDPYHWIVLSKNQPSVAGREILDPATWRTADPVDIGARLDDAGIPRLVIDRIEEGPEKWAQRLLRKKLQDLKGEFEERIRSENTEIARKFAELIEQLESSIRGIQSKSPELWEIYLQLPDQDGDLPARLADEFARCRRTAESRSQVLLAEYARASALFKNLLRPGPGDEGGLADASPLFGTEDVRFAKLSEKWRELAPVMACFEAYKRSYDEYKTEFEKLSVDYGHISAELEETRAKVVSLSDQLENEVKRRKLEEERKNEARRELEARTNEIASREDDVRLIPKVKAAEPYPSRLHAFAAKYWLWGVFGLLGFLLLVLTIFLLHRFASSPTDEGAEPENSRQVKPFTTNPPDSVPDIKGQNNDDAPLPGVSDSPAVPAGNRPSTDIPADGLPDPTPTEDGEHAARDKAAEAGKETARPQPKNATPPEQKGQSVKSPDTPADLKAEPKPAAKPAAEPAGGSGEAPN